MEPFVYKTDFLQKMSKLKGQNMIRIMKNDARRDKTPLK